MRLNRYTMNKPSGNEWPGQGTGTRRVCTTHRYTMSKQSGPAIMPPIEGISDSGDGRPMLLPPMPPLMPPPIPPGAPPPGYIGGRP